MEEEVVVVVVFVGDGRVEVMYAFPQREQLVWA